MDTGCLKFKASSIVLEGGSLWEMKEAAAAHENTGSRIMHGFVKFATPECEKEVGISVWLQYR